MRRDPLDLPLLEEDRHTEWLLAVSMNGELRPEAVFVIEEPGTGRLLVELATAYSWRLRVDEDAIVTYQGLPFYPLDATPGIGLAMDSADLTLDLQIPGTAFVESDLDLALRERPLPERGTGGFLDYDLLVSGGDEIATSFDGLVELGAFGSLGTLLTSFRLGDLTDAPEVTRLESTFFRDLPEKRASLRIGDSLTTGGAFARGVRFTGLQYATNFATDPGFVTFPVPTIGGLAEQSSVVEVLIDNVTRATTDVNAGPFTLSNIPVVTGAGEVQLKITDLLGRERLVTQSYYVSPRLLREGLHEFSYEIGAARRHFGETSQDYGDPLASMVHRYGFDDALTFEAHAEAEPDRVGTVLGGGLHLGTFGVLTGGFGISAHKDDGLGEMVQLAWEAAKGPLSGGLRTRYTGSDFRQHGETDGGVRRVDQANLSVNLGSLGRIGLLGISRSRRDAADDRSLSASYSLAAGPGSFLFNAAYAVDPSSELALTASYTLPLGESRSLSTQARKSGSDESAKLIYRKGRGRSDLGLDYRLAAELARDTGSADLRMDYGSRLAELRLEADLREDKKAARVGAGGSIAFLDGHVIPSRRIGRAFGLVDLAGLPDVSVYLDNREVGATDAQGRLLLSDLRPYERNQVKVELNDLPLDATVTSGEAVVVPYDRSGVRVALEVERDRSATVMLRKAGGEALPGGLTLVGDGDAHGLVGRDGLAELGGLPAEGSIELRDATGNGLACRIDVPPPSDDPMPHLGEVTCHP